MLQVLLRSYRKHSYEIISSFPKCKNFMLLYGGSTLKFPVIASGSLILVCCAYDTAVQSTQAAYDGRNLLQKASANLKAIYDDRILASGVVRFGRVALTVLQVILDYKFSLRGVGKDNAEYESRKSQCHTRSAIRFKHLCSLNGGVFIKIGQHIGSLDFIFPDEYLTVLKCFQKDAPQSSIDDIKFVVRHDTGKSVEESFLYFEEKPIGAASLAQVHRATLRSGEAVAVKVQHKVVEQHAFRDAATIEFFVKIAAKLFPEFQFQWLVDELKKNIPLELDFLNEGKNCEKVGEMLRKFDFLKVPKIYWNHSTKRVLVMELCDGGAVDDIAYIKKHGLCANDISKKLGRLYSEMIFVNGYVHCDPHPGNVLVRRNAKNTADIVLLDHGLYQTLPAKLRLDYCKLWQSLISADMHGIERYGRSLGVGKYYGLLACMVSGRSWEALKAGIQNKKLSSKEMSEIQEFAVQYVHIITEILNMLPREMILIFKTNDLLRGLDARLKTSASSASFVTMARCCARAVMVDDLSKCTSVWSTAKVYLRASLDHVRIAIYQFSLTPVGVYCAAWYHVLRSGMYGAWRSLQSLSVGTS